MTINIVSKNIKIDDALRAAIETGIGSIENRFKGSPSCKVTIKPIENNFVKVSVLIYAGKYVFKGESSHKDKVSAFNKALKEIERNLNKLKTKQLMKRYMPNDVKDTVDADNAEMEQVADMNRFISTKKEIKVLPMTIEEAYMQMELLGHTFFAFVNIETGLMNILYRKRSSEESYGLIQLTR